MDCKGVKEVMGLPRSIDLVSPISSGIMISIAGDEGGLDIPISGGVLGLLFASVSGSPVYKNSSFCEEISVS